MVGILDQFFEGKAGWARRRLQQGERLSGRQWAKVIEVSGDDPLPPDLRQHLIDFLQSARTTGNRRGRKPKAATQTMSDHAREMLHNVTYRRVLKLFEERADRKKETGRRKRRALPRATATPQELTLRYMKIHHESLRRVALSTLRNRLSRS
jgi:hypothetical protein